MNKNEMQSRIWNIDDLTENITGWLDNVPDSIFTRWYIEDYLNAQLSDLIHLLSPYC